jgi:hypothetical protein
LSTDGVLPGNDPSVHLLRAKQIIINEKISYSEISWYPPFFHTIVAMIQILAGTVDIMVASFILKMLIATLNVLLILSTYLLARKLFGKGTAVASTLFTIISVPLFEMIFWGGYANIMGLAYIAFIFYILNKDLGVKVKTLLLFSGAFTLILIHHLTTFVFVLTFVPIFLINSTGSKRKFITFLTVIIGVSLAMLAWYARIIIDYIDSYIEYIFFSMGENFYHIPFVSIETLLKNLGVTLFITFLGIPLMFIIKKKETSIKDLLLIIFWFVVPFLFAESYLFRINLPYHRFIYFIVTPIAILSGVVTYFCITKIPKIIKSKLVTKVRKNHKSIIVIRILVLTVVFSLMVFHGSTFLKRIETYPDFYERASISSYNSGLWVKQHSAPDGIVITTRSPGSWFYIFSDHRTIQETDPLSSRSVIAESVLYSFYEIENSRSLTREFDQVNPSAGQAIYVSRFNLWTKVVSIPNEYVKFIYVDPLGEWVQIPLSETNITNYWTQNSTENGQLVTEYVHKLFTIQKVVTVSSNSRLININWHVQTHQELESVKLDVSNFFNLSLDFKEALIPRVLEWQNPWDNATYINKEKEWAVVNGSDISSEKVTAILDAQNGVIAAFDFNEIPDFYILGALNDRSIDSFRVLFELGYLNELHQGEISFSVFVHSFELEDIDRWTSSELDQQFDEQTNLIIKGRDFFTFIEEYNIKFIAIDTQQVVSNIETTPAFDKIYNNGKSIVYTTKK